MFKAIVSVPTTEPPEFISVRPIGCVQLLSPSKPVRFPHPNTHTLENSAVTERIHTDSHILPFRSTPEARPTGDGARKHNSAKEKEEEKWKLLKQAQTMLKTSLRF